MSLRYEQLSERSGVIVDDQERACILLHINMSGFPDCEDQMTIRPVTSGETPTLLNKEAATRWIALLGEEGRSPLPHPDNKAKPEPRKPEAKKIIRAKVDDALEEAQLRSIELGIQDTLESLIPITGFAANGEAI